MDLSDSMCRVCMRNDESITVSSEIVYMLHFCAQIAEHDRIPRGVCEQCREDLQVAYRFRTMCEESNEKFWQIINQGEEDEEPSDIIEECDTTEEMEDMEEKHDEVLEVLEVVDGQIMAEGVEYELHSREKQDIAGEVEAIEDSNIIVTEYIEELPAEEQVEKDDKSEIQLVKKIIRRGRPRKNPIPEDGVVRIPKSPKNFLCNQCGRSFKKKKLLKRHEMTHNEPPKERPQKVRIRRVSPPKKENGLRPCKFCKEILQSDQELNEHMNELHMNERPYLCSECGTRFVRHDYLVIHLRRHKGEKPYTCRFCGKGFPRATDLTVHERYHTGEKTHLCTICGKGFHRAYNLLVHMRVHTGEKPYQCPHCEKSFAQGNDLKAHVRRHTGERFKCDMCNEGFIQGYHLTQHKRQMHGVIITSHIRRLEKFYTEETEEIKEEIEDGEQIVWEQTM